MTKINRIVIEGDNGFDQTIDLGGYKPFTINDEGILTVHKAEVEAPAIVKGLGDEGLISSKGFVILFPYQNIVSIQSLPVML